MREAKAKNEGLKSIMCPVHKEDFYSSFKELKVNPFAKTLYNVDPNLADELSLNEYLNDLNKNQ